MSKNVPHSAMKFLARSAKNSKNSLPLEVQKMHVIDGETARVVILVDPVFRGKLSEEAMASAVSDKMEDVRYLPGSMHRVSENDSRLVSFFVKKNVETMPIEKASANGLTKVNDTVYQDENDAIWTVVQDGETSYLVASVEEDINALLSNMKIRSLATASSSVSLEEDFGEGMFVSYYDFANEERAFGVAIDGAQVYNFDRKTIQNVESAAVILVSEDNNAPQADRAEVASLSGATPAERKKKMIEYYTKLYGHHPEFLKRLKEIINQTVSA